MTKGEIASKGKGSDHIEPFIARWQGREGGQERANYGLFLPSFATRSACRPPDPAGASPANERLRLRTRGKETGRDGGEISSRRIDLYKRGCFRAGGQAVAPEGRRQGKQVAGQADLFPASDAHARPARCGSGPGTC